MALTRTYTVSYGSGGDYVTRNSTSDGAIKKIDTDLTTAYTHLNNLQKHYAGTSAPSSPQTGQTWYDTSAQALKIYDGSAWDYVGGPVDLEHHSYPVGQTPTTITTEAVAGNFNANYTQVIAASTITSTFYLVGLQYYCSDNAQDYTVKIATGAAAAESDEAVINITAFGSNPMSGYISIDPILIAANARVSVNGTDNEAAANTIDLYVHVKK